jgi:outer membrane protein assembly factor BamB
MRLSSLIIIFLISLLLRNVDVFASDWPGWRGPTGIGVTDEKGLPLTWDGKTGANILWKAPLTGTTGHSSPIVWGERVFVTTATRQTRDEESRKEIPEHHLVCFQVSDGKLLWRTLIMDDKSPFLRENIGKTL